MNNKKILYLDGNPSDEYYNKIRNTYSGVCATSIFINNTLIQKLLRRTLLKVKLPFNKSLFGSWKNEIDKFDVVIIATNMYSPIIKEFIRKRSQIKIIHWYWNPVHNSLNPDLLKDGDGEIWSFDKEDCIKYSLNYSPTYYFENLYQSMKDKIYDVFFIGADKGRIGELIELENIFKKIGLVVNFHITKSASSDNKDYCYKPRISYEEVLNKIYESKAILDIVQENQIGLSQRPMEALFFKKKLITNDKNIDKYDFYNKNNIFILGKDKIEGIRDFILSPYNEVACEVIRNYTFEAWVNRLTNFEKLESSHD